MKNTIWVVPIEPIDQRYTKQWYTNIPQLITEASDKFEVITIDGVGVAEVTTQGAFLDFALTNVYKASQIEWISRLFSRNIVKPGDRFLVTDAWHFGIPAIKYMSELLDIPVEIHGIWHAGHYDPTDILGMKMSNDWPKHFERSLYHALDFSYFATEFHIDMFCGNLSLSGHKAIRSGQPHTPIIKELEYWSFQHKKDVVVFPHRLNADKQPLIAGDLSTIFTFDITQGKNLSKNEYYQRLGQARVIFSCALHENLGISVMEGVLAGAIPVVPDRASYSEMYLDVFKYPSEWTLTWEEYERNKDDLILLIQDRFEHYGSMKTELDKQRQILIDKYLTPTVMIDNITR